MMNLDEIMEILHNRKPNTPSYFDDREFLKLISMEERNRFENWLGNNENFHNEVNEWDKAFNFFKDKTTNDEILIKSGEYLYCLFIKYFGIYMQLKR